MVRGHLGKSAEYRPNSPNHFNKTSENQIALANHPNRPNHTMERGGFFYNVYTLLPISRARLRFSEPFRTLPNHNSCNSPNRASAAHGSGEFRTIRSIEVNCQPSLGSSSDPNRITRRITNQDYAPAAHSRVAPAPRLLPAGAPIRADTRQAVAAASPLGWKVRTGLLRLPTEWPCGR